MYKRTFEEKDLPHIDDSLCETSFSYKGRQTNFIL